MRANIPNACGFTVTGELLGADFGIDGVTLAGPTAFDGQGQAHVMYNSQGVVLDFYRAGGADYVRLYEHLAPTAVPDQNLTALWTEFGVSSSVVNKAGSTKWVRLTSAQERAFNHSDMLGALGTPSSLATALADGTAAAWKLSGTEVVDGIRCTAVTDPPKGRQEFAETIYVNDKTGLPVTVRYAAPSSVPSASFSHWSSAPAITRPTQVVAGESPPGDARKPSAVRRRPGVLLSTSVPAPPSDINLTVPAGGAFGFLGHNGAGKTTLIRMLVSLTLPSAGTIRWRPSPGPPPRAGAGPGRGHHQFFASVPVKFGGSSGEIT